jgi:hypothetical protein
MASGGMVGARSFSKRMRGTGGGTGGGMGGGAGGGRAGATRPWRRGLGDAALPTRLGDARSLKLRGPGGERIGMASGGMVGARSFSKRMRGTGGAAGGGDAAVVTRPWPRGLGDAALATRAR